MLRRTGPRAGSMTATTSFELLGTSKTIPSRRGPRVVTVTRSPVLVSSMPSAYRPAGIAIPGADHRRVRGAARRVVEGLATGRWGLVHGGEIAVTMHDLPFAVFPAVDVRHSDGHRLHAAVLSVMDEALEADRVPHVATGV